MVGIEAVRAVASQVAHQPVCYMMVKCPNCGVARQFEDNPFRPFCSERCRLLDLGNWLSGTYAVPAAPQEAGESSKADDKPEDS